MAIAQFGRGRSVLSGRLAEAGDERTQWCIDNWDALTAEVRAELGINQVGRRRRCIMAWIWSSIPGVDGGLPVGAVDYRVISMILFRCTLITDPALQAEIDERLATSASKSWNGLSHNRLMGWSMAGA